MKVSIIGVGHVGSAIAFSLLHREWTGNLVLIDIDNKKLFGEILDLSHASKLLNQRVKLSMSGNIMAAKGSDYVVICAGFPRKKEETMDSLYKRNLNIIEKICMELQYCCDSVIIMVTNPADRFLDVAGQKFRQVWIPDAILDDLRMRFYHDAKKVINAGNEIIGYKGYTNWGVASVVADFIVSKTPASIDLLID